jgi:hypothetical protein
MQRKQNSQHLDINKQFVFIRKSRDLMQACNENKQLANIVGDVKEVQVLSYS